MNHVFITFAAVLAWLDFPSPTCPSRLLTLYRNVQSSFVKNGRHTVIGGIGRIERHPCPLFGTARIPTANNHVVLLFA